MMKTQMKYSWMCVINKHHSYNKIMTLKSGNTLFYCLNTSFKSNDIRSSFNNIKFKWVVSSKKKWFSGVYYQGILYCSNCCEKKRVILVQNSYITMILVKYKACFLSKKCFLVTQLKLYDWHSVHAHCVSTSIGR
jgi:hypothetical protein